MHVVVGGYSVSCLILLLTLSLVVHPDSLVQELQENPIERLLEATVQQIRHLQGALKFLRLHKLGEVWLISSRQEIRETGVPVLLTAHQSCRFVH